VFAAGAGQDVGGAIPDCYIGGVLGII